MNKSNSKINYGSALRTLTFKTNTMNLLSYQNRFDNLPPTHYNAGEVNGYTKALVDLLQLLKDMTGYNPDRRMVDSVAILDAIGKTNEHLTRISLEYEKKLKEVNQPPVEDLNTELRHSEIF